MRTKESKNQFVVNKKQLLQRVTQATSIGIFNVNFESVDLVYLSSSRFSNDKENVREAIRRFGKSTRFKIVVGVNILL